MEKGQRLLAQNQDNVSEESDKCTQELLFQ
jgi:hypothetical protein